MPGPDGQSVSVTTFAPPGVHGVPGWIALHGITVPGRHHPSLVRFARAMAASGAVVVIPEVARWRDLRLDIDDGTRVVNAAIEALDRDARTAGRPGLIGFSFGGPQVIRLAADDTVGPRLSGVASFGGFADIEVGLRFQMTGRIRTPEGERFLRPDPYARWIFAANFLPHVTGEGAFVPVADALHALALEAGTRRTPAWDAMYDPLKSDLEAALPDEEARSLFRFFAPDAEQDPNPDHPAVEAWVTRLTTAARRIEPRIEVPEGLELHAPAHIIHGRSDRLFPFTESEALAARIASPRPTRTITGLFAHSSSEGGGGIGAAVESVRLANALRRVLGIPGN